VNPVTSTPPAPRQVPHYLSLTKLEHFLALSRARSFARAAAELGISQPALSRSIASLEQDCGTRLLDRGRGRAAVTVTDAGAELLVDSETLLQHARTVTLTATGGPPHTHVHVRFGIGPLLMRLILPGALLGVLRDFPEASFETVSEQPQLMRQRLLRGELDMVVAPFQVQPPDARVQAARLGGQTPTFQVRPGHPLLEHELVTTEMMARFPLVSGTVWNEMLPLLGARLARQLRAQVEIDNIDVLVAIVHDSDAVLLFSVPEAGWGLEALRVDLPVAMREWGNRSVDVLTRSGIDLSPPARALLAELRTEFVRTFSH
jgi:DNA-binding transcriptional LysR family regulator